MTTKKSESPTISPKGNVAKYLSYREAWTRIKLARKEGFFFEAITIEESIITDRLINYLVFVGEIKQPTEVYKYPKFHELIQSWKKLHPIPIQATGQSSLQEAVDQWRILRNKAIHGMVKSHPGSPTEAIDDFLAIAESAAIQGEFLAKAVSEWCRKMKKKQQQSDRLTSG
ncbi:hypothetical protein AMR41_20340 [Hapalosiphon sp. MRB220]|nr:hypothetical protein AMR41_20340 [Hapalosiphon sp. MRB220]